MKVVKTILSILLVIIVVALVAIAGKFILGGGSGFGTGDNNTGNGDSSQTVLSTSDVPSEAPSVTIRIDQDTIYYNDEVVESADALKELIVKNHTDDTTYHFDNENAVLDTNNEVKAVLDELQNGSLGIKVE